jgi:ribosomal-protein-alanine N-acetyltransferase
MISHAVGIRPASIFDLMRIAEIEAMCFVEPWDLDYFFDAFKRFNILLFEHEDEAVGYVVWKQVRNSIEIVNIAVHPERRHEGIGQELCAALAGTGLTIITYVIESNLIAQLFFRSLGFRAIQIHHDHNADVYEFRRRKRLGVTT